jgi:hypothetical protein
MQLSVLALGSSNALLMLRSELALGTSNALLMLRSELALGTSNTLLMLRSELALGTSSRPLMLRFELAVGTSRYKCYKDMTNCPMSLETSWPCFWGVSLPQAQFKNSAFPWPALLPMPTPRWQPVLGIFPFFFEISHFKAYSEHFRYIGGPSREAR